MQRERSFLILERIKNNALIIVQWFEMLLEQRLKEYEETRYVKPAFSVLTVEGRADYQSYDIENISGDSNRDFLHVLKANHYYGVPLVACSYSCLINITPENSEPQEALFITLETPLRKSRQIYLSMEIEGKRKLVLDGYLSRFAKLAPEINRFNHIIPNEIANLS